MRRQLFVILSVTTLLLSTTSLSFAQTKISGLVFGDYYFVADNHNEELKSMNGFWLRRVYVTFDHQFEDNLSARVRFEAASPGDFKSGGKIEPFVKHLYLNWKASNNHSFYFGLSSPPTYSVVEEVWGYRQVEKTPSDLYLFAPSSDFGIALKGQLFNNGRFRYHGMIANGSGTNAETNSGKRAMVSVGYYPNKTFLIEGYVDTESRPENENRHTYQVFSAVKGDRSRIGFLLTRINRNRISLEDNFDLASVFIVQSIAEKVNYLFRYDKMFNPNPAGEKISYLPFDQKSKSNLLIWGLDYQVNKNLSLIPNAELVLYESKVRSDFIPRFTLYFTF